mgnify:CR=1 FL=1
MNLFVWFISDKLHIEGIFPHRHILKVHLAFIIRQSKTGYDCITYRDQICRGPGDRLVTLGILKFNLHLHTPSLLKHRESHNHLTLHRNRKDKGHKSHIQTLHTKIVRRKKSNFKYTNPISNIRPKFTLSQEFHN